jgi:putative N6-adenine-specific DNA methylase
LEKLFAVAAPGLAPYTAQELRAIGFSSSGTRSGGQAHPPAPGQSKAGGGDEEFGGVEFSGDLYAIYRANLHLRTANRVLVRLGDFPAVGFAELRKRAGRLPWERFVSPGQGVALRVTCHKSRLYHSDAVAERVAGAIGDHLGRPPLVLKFDEQTERDPPQLIVVRLLHDQCTISIDTSGALLHRRGYRLATAKAPLRETLAAGVLLASGWNPADTPLPPLLDPFCGSGTIPIEAALWACGVAPGHSRRFAFMDWPGFDAALWESVRTEAEKQQRVQTSNAVGRLRILASDRDAGAIEIAQANAARAGVAELIEFSCRPVSAITPPTGPGWIVTNPPYGQRVSANQDVRNLYAQFGKVLRTQCAGWRIAVLCSDQLLLRQMGMPLDSSVALFNGGIAVTLGRATVPVHG